MCGGKNYVGLTLKRAAIAISDNDNDETQPTVLCTPCALRLKCGAPRTAALYQQVLLYRVPLFLAKEFGRRFSILYLGNLIGNVCGRYIRLES